MMSSTHARYEAVLQMELPRLEKEGYTVFLHPSRTMLPAFLHRRLPDAIAVKSDKKIAIEIVTSYGQGTGAKEGGTKPEDTRKLFSDHPDWELRVIYAPPRVPEHYIPIASREAIEAQLKRMENAFDAAGPVAGLLWAWSAFEAAARALLPDTLSGPQAPADLLERMAFDGHVTPDEADDLRRFGNLWMEAAHGSLEVTFTRDDLARIVAITRIVLSLYEPATSP